MNPYWETITSETRQVLTALGQQAFCREFYLAGGTALALQIGHRHSIDLDFFSEADEVGESTREAILRALKPIGMEVIRRVDGALVMNVNAVRVGFFSYGYSLINSPFRQDELSIASLVDIGLMKCDALIRRGGRKDFIDLFFIAQPIPLERLLRLGKKKYPLFRDFHLMLLESMTLFKNAERDAQPDMLSPVSWQNIKDFFLLHATVLSNAWFDTDNPAASMGIPDE